MQAFFDSHTMSMLTFNKAEKAEKRQDLMDGLLRSAYPFISEGRGLTSSLTPLELPYNVKVLPKYVPEGEEDFTTLILGQLGEKPLSVKIWKDGSQVFCTCSHDFLKWRFQWMFLDRTIQILEYQTDMDVRNMDDQCRGPSIKEKFRLVGY